MTARRYLEGRLELETHPWFVDALGICRWDDDARDPAAHPAPLIAYRGLLEPLFGPQSWSDRPGIGA